MGAVPELKIHRSIIKALEDDADRFHWLDEAAAAGPVSVLRMGPVKTWIVTDPEDRENDAGRRRLLDGRGHLRRLCRFASSG